MTELQMALSGEGGGDQVSQREGQPVANVAFCSNRSFKSFLLPTEGEVGSLVKAIRVFL
jgi:hypothetical protein